MYVMVEVLRIAHHSLHPILIVGFHHLFSGKITMIHEREIGYAAEVSSLHTKCGQKGEVICFTFKKT